METIERYYESAARNCGLSCKSETFSFGNKLRIEFKSNDNYLSCYSQAGIIFQLLGAADDDEEEKKADGDAAHKRTPKVDAESGTREPLTNSQQAEAANDDSKRQNGDAENGEKDGTAEESVSSNKKQQSVLQAKLTRLAFQIGYCGTIVAVGTILILILRFSIETFLIEQKAWSGAFLQYLFKFIIIGVTVLVVAVPEGLPLAVTLALAYSVRVRYDGHM
jgi:P-type Ca2+ transporter type 2B